MIHESALSPSAVDGQILNQLPTHISEEPITFTLLTLVGAYGAFLWAHALTTDRVAVAAAFLHTLAPYHANELYQSGMYGQYAAGGVLPFVFAFVERVTRRGRWRDVAGLGVSYGLLILTHAPLAVLGSLAVAAYALVRLIQSFSPATVCRLVAGALLGIALSCCYWLPMLRELKWKRPSGAGQGEWFDYRNNFLFQASPSEMSNYWLPILTAATALFAAPALVLLFKRNSKALAPVVLALLTFLMATPLSRPLWDALPFLQETQFPWRWLTITSACLAILATISIPELARLWRTRRVAALPLIGSMVIALSVSALQVVRGATFQDRATFNRTASSLPASATNKDFLPPWADAPRKESPPVEAAGRGVSALEWSPERRVFRVEPGPETEARLRTFYYPHWVAAAGGVTLRTRPAEDGALLVSIPPDAAVVDVRFVEPTSTRIAGATSIMGLLAVVSLMFIAARE